MKSKPWQQNRTVMRRCFFAFFKHMAVDVLSVHGRKQLEVKSWKASHDKFEWYGKTVQEMSDIPHLMRGSKNGVITQNKEKFNPHILDVGGCSLHYISNTVSHDVETLATKSNSYASMFLYFSSIWPLMCSQFKEVQETLDVPHHKHFCCQLVGYAFFNQFSTNLAPKS